ncbi:adenylate/guanylate cyclase domain-containing protein [Amycolatopsis rubida]|uniref:Adenylate/guanylate cyclase domain-containing protein n=1 Tax=Amycolatopsis rubida TaxID=112413 RepID=A0ABX0C4W2_9PSEU|nr:adenylate/guanylate cyclase domain-containing protein [Amycolatopsis sp. M39]MYW97168.1 HAMP domain-containing protein [Amycolatopsis rubida]NEC62153.1 adenylate/guanylate cyclase domain-containing protein [Amycolatopsis rubida]
MRKVIAGRFRLVLRTSLGFAALGVGSSVAGAGVVALLLLLQGLPEDVDDRGWVLGVTAAGVVALALIVGTLWTAYLQRRTVVWFTIGRPPTADEAKRALRLPFDMAVVSGTLWLIGSLALGILAGALGSLSDAAGIALTIGLGGLTTVGLTYLAAEWVARPVMTMALDVLPPRGALPVTVLTRLVVTWVLASGVPLIGVLLVTTPPDLGRNGNPTASLIVLSVTGLTTGAIGTALLSRAVAAPLHRLRIALDGIARGRTDVRVDVDDSSEIGMVQTSVNDLVAGLREQDRMRDLFGRHVGADVARHALEYGASLSGDVREVTALFVDVVDSTALASRTPPQELVEKLNRFFASVVSAVDARGGLVNKFQGDAALCVFGAPTRLSDGPTMALAAARAIRDAVLSEGELDLGIGVATGQVFAGQLGASSRLEYTVIGDAVNEAARLTEHAKAVPSRVLASETTVKAALGGEREHWRLHGELHLRGRHRETRTWTT